MNVRNSAAPWELEHRRPFRVKELWHELQRLGIDTGRDFTVREKPFDVIVASQDP